MSEPATIEKCNRSLIAMYLAGEMELEEQLEFLLHVDECDQCWRQIYEVRKAEHPQFYKPVTRNPDARSIAATIGRYCGF